MRPALRSGGTAKYSRRSERRLRGIRFSLTAFLRLVQVKGTSSCLPNFRGGGDLSDNDDNPSHKQKMVVRLPNNQASNSLWQRIRGVHGSFVCVRVAERRRLLLGGGPFPCGSSLTSCFDAAQPWWIRGVCVCVCVLSVCCFSYVSSNP